MPAVDTRKVAPCGGTVVDVGVTLTVCAQRTGCKSQDATQDLIWQVAHLCHSAGTVQIVLRGNTVALPEQCVKRACKAMTPLVCGLAPQQIAQARVMPAKQRADGATML